MAAPAGASRRYLALRPEGRSSRRGYHRCSRVPGSILNTKLFVPQRRAGLVARPRLAEQLSRVWDSRLTLVSAPAGFGKTTLLAAWLASARLREPATAWLSLDQSDNDPTTFWTYVIAALQSVAPGLGAHALALMEAGHTPMQMAVTTLLNELAGLSGDVVLVLDDYHVLTHGQIHEAVALFVDRLPPNVHLVLASRADPPFPIDRFRAARRVGRRPSRGSALYLRRGRGLLQRSHGAGPRDPRRAHRRLDRGPTVGSALDARPRQPRGDHQRLTRTASKELVAAL